MVKRMSLKDKFKLLIVKYKSMIAGKEPLAATFWLWGVVGMIIVLMLPLFILLLLYMALFGMPTPIFALFINLLWLVYGITVAVGVWRSANAYQGPRIFPNAAKLFVAVGLLFWIQQLYIEIPALYETGDGYVSSADKELFDTTLGYANQGNAAAQTLLADMYVDGQGAPKNYVAAYMWYTIAAAQGDLGASLNKDVVKDLMTPKQIAEAERLTEEWFEKHQTEGAGKTSLDIVTPALEQLLTKSDNGDPEAQYQLGLMFANGDGVAENDRIAWELYHEAAAQGHARAQYNLALMYYFGEGVAESDANSEKWLRLAADQGLADAQFRLGGMYLAGISMPEDFVLGYMWWNLAAAKGYQLPSGKKATVGLQELRKKMNSKQIAEAERLTKEWLEEHQ